MGRPQQRQRQLTPFSQFLQEHYGDPAELSGAAGCRDRQGRPCRLCWAGRVTLEREETAKALSLQRWAAQIASLPRPTLMPPPPPGRHYRQVSKRRWVHESRQLLMVETVERGRVRGISPLQCLVEPLTHGQLYQALQGELKHSSLSRWLNYAIVKSGTQGETLILNLSDSRKERGELNRISKKLTHHFERLRSIWLIQGQQGDDYYANVRPGQWQKLWGEEFLEDSLGLQYSPLSFSQIHQAAVPQLLETTRQWLGNPKLPLLDLFCGYGLFSLGLGRLGPCWGLESSGESVLWARRNARRLKSPARFDCWDLTQREIPERRFPPGPWVAVVDPPRSGASPELIRHLAEMRPTRVVHWVCDSQVLQEQLASWIEGGYRVGQAVAVDMFSGTDSIEIGLCLEPGGRLRNAKPSHLISQAGKEAPCKPPKKPVNSPVSSTGSGARPKPPKR